MRITKQDSFDFVIQSIGIYTNNEILDKACDILINKFLDLHTLIETDELEMNPSLNTMSNSYDIILKNEDYTIGKVIEFMLYTKFYENLKILTFCGFKKFHPHNNDSTLRIAYEQNADKRMVAQHLRIVCIEAGQVFEKIYKMF